LLSWCKCLEQPARLARGWFGRKEKGIALIETLVALAIVGVVAVTFLGGVGTATKATVISNEQATAESLVRSEIEYVRKCAYQYHDAPGDPAVYSVDPALTIPQGWVVPPPVVELVHATDDGIQKVTVTAEHHGEAILSVVTYKVDR